jgi:hypothetical protein
MNDIKNVTTTHEVKDDYLQVKVRFFYKEDREINFRMTKEDLDKTYE